MTNAIEVHGLLMEQARTLDLPKAFHRDLEFHDLNALQEIPDGQLLLWGIGECGTHMIKLDRYESPEFYAKRIHNVDHWFLIRDGKLEPVTEVNAR